MIILKCLLRLIRALKRSVPDLQVEGVGGPLMRDAGCRCLHDADELAVMGLVEVLAELPRLLRLRRGLVRHWRDNPPDVFVGVDAPDFNLGLEARVKAAGSLSAPQSGPGARGGCTRSVVQRTWSCACCHSRKPFMTGLMCPPYL